MFILSSFTDGIIRYLPSQLTDEANNYFGMPKHFIITYTKNKPPENNNDQGIDSISNTSLLYIFIKNENRKNIYIAGLELCYLLPHITIDENTYKSSKYQQYCEDVFNFLLDAFEEINCQMNVRLRKNYIVDTITTCTYSNSILLTRRDVYLESFNKFKQSILK